MENMEKRAFTLIELLSVIVVLAILMIIAIPNLLNLIEKSKEQSIVESTRSITRAAKNYYAEQIMNNNIISEIDLQDNKLKYDGRKPEKGMIYFKENNKTYLKMYYQGYCVEKDESNEINLKKISEDKCNIIYKKEDCVKGETPEFILTIEEDENIEPDKININSSLALEKFKFSTNSNQIIITDIKVDSLENISSCNGYTCGNITIPNIIENNTVTNINIEEIRNTYPCVEIVISKSLALSIANTTDSQFLLEKIAEKYPEIIWDSQISSDNTYLTITGLKQLGQKIKKLKTPEQINNVDVTQIDSINSFNLEKLIVTKNIRKFTNVEIFGTYNLKEVEMQVENGFTLIGDTWFRTSNLKKLEYTNPNLTILPDYAFASASKLTEIKLNGNIQEIGQYAFYNVSNLTKITGLKNVKKIGNYAFLNCKNLTNIDEFTKLEEIGNNAFENCTKLQTINNLSTVTNIGNYAFKNCTNLQTLQNLDNIVKIGQYAFQNCKNFNEALVIPKTIRAIGGFFLAGSNLKSVELQVDNNYQQIMYDVFRNSNVEEIKYTNNELTKLPDYAFARATKLTNYYYPDSIKIIGEHAFYNCTSLTSIDIKENVWRIDQKILSGSGIEEVNIYGKAVSGLHSLTWNEGEKLTSINYLSDELTVLPAYAFAHTSTIKEVTLKSNIKKINNKAFENCTGLITINGMENIEEIGDNAFLNCTSLIEISIPNTLKQISTTAFTGCSNLTTIKYSGKIGGAPWGAPNATVVAE